jgi:hypothetical protein
VDYSHIKTGVFGTESDPRFLIDLGGDPSYLERHTVRELRDELDAWLRETQPKLPSAGYAVIDAQVDYGTGEFTQRLVLMPNIPRSYWLNPEGDEVSAESIVSFEVVRPGLADG